MQIRLKTAKIYESAFGFNNWGVKNMKELAKNNRSKYAVKYFVPVIYDAMGNPLIEEKKKQN